MSISGVFFTNKGRILQAQVQTGTQLHFTRIAIGDGELQGQVQQTFNTLINEKLSIEITKLVTGKDGTAKVGGSFNNSNLNTGFYYRELGLFVRDPNDSTKEILYVYGNAGALADYIPAQGSELVEKKIDIIAMIGNATNVSATINSSLVGLGPEDLERHDKDPEAHKPIRDWFSGVLQQEEEARSLADSNLNDQIKILEGQIDNFDNSWDGITGKPDTFSPSKHQHTKAEIKDFPTALPANGGNADTVDGKHASDFFPITGGTVKGQVNATGKVSASFFDITSENGIGLIHNGYSGKIVRAQGADSSGAMVAFGGGGLTVIGGGEAATNYTQQLPDGGSFGSENAIVCADSSVIIRSNVQNGFTNANKYEFKNGDLFIGGVGLKQSVSDGKKAIATAITGKGVSASGNDTHAALATKIGQIQTGSILVKTVYEMYGGIGSTSASLPKTLGAKDFVIMTWYVNSIYESYNHSGCYLDGNIIRGYNDGESSIRVTISVVTAERVKSCQRIVTTAKALIAGLTIKKVDPAKCIVLVNSIENYSIAVTVTATTVEANVAVNDDTKVSVQIVEFM